MSIHIPNLTPGQPLDFNYINQIVNNLNLLADTLNDNKSLSSIGTGDSVAEPKSTRSANVAFSTGYQEVQLSKTNKGATAKFSFGVNFTSIPIVTATIRIPSSTTISSHDLSITVSSVTKDTANISVYYNGTTTLTSSATIGVNLIAVGSVA